MPWSMALRTMWISGSRIFSIISRSSSTSPPLVVKLTFLPMSCARSRTIRGKGENNLSMRCIRIWLTDCRIPAIESDSRSNEAITAASAPDSRSIRANSLRARTMSVTPVITLSSSGSGTRIERQLARSA